MNAVPLCLFLHSRRMRQTACSTAVHFLFSAGRHPSGFEHGLLALRGSVVTRWVAAVQ